MCEKQIVIPNNSILYCSEGWAYLLAFPSPQHWLTCYLCSCRRKDANIHDNDPSLSFMPSLLTSPIYDGDEPLGFGTRTILPHKLPTPCPLSTRIPAIAHDGKSDLDPTEWKPCEEGSSKEKPGGEGKGSAWRPKLAHRPSSEAHTYLSQFHRSVPASTRRPGLPNRSTPSLSHTPTTTASSDNSMAGTPTEIAEQPLMPRADTILPKSAGVKGAELVTPKLASMAITAQVDSVKGDGMDNSLVHDISYDKKWVLNRKASAAGSLKKLLGRDEVDSTALAM